MVLGGRTHPHVPAIVACFFVRLCGFLFAWVQYCVCVLVCVGVCWCAWEGGRECSHETTPGGTDKTAVLS